MEILYKTDNLVILLQTLCLFFLTIQIRLINVTFYGFLYGFRWIVGYGIWHKWSPDGIYIESSSTSMAMIGVDGNLIRNCGILAIFIAGMWLCYFIIGVLGMKRQTLVFWRRRNPWQ